MILIAIDADNEAANYQNHSSSACPALLGEEIKTSERDAIPGLLKAFSLIIEKPWNDTALAHSLVYFSGLFLQSYDFRSEKRLSAAIAAQAFVHTVLNGAITYAGRVW